jgi:hypothetical protein
MYSAVNEEKENRRIIGYHRIEGERKDAWGRKPYSITAIVGGFHQVQAHDENAVKICFVPAINFSKTHAWPFQNLGPARADWWRLHFGHGRALRVSISGNCPCGRCIDACWHFGTDERLCRFEDEVILPSTCDLVLTFTTFLCISVQLGKSSSFKSKSILLFHFPM